MRGFPKEEFINRVAKLRQLMEKNHVDAIIITSPSNFRYFTGLDSYFWESPTRPWFVLIPLLKDPIAIVPSIGLSSLEKTWIDNIITWNSPNPEDEGISTVLNAIHSLKIEKGNIGFELGKESFLRMKINDFRKLENQLQNFSIIDSSPLLWELRLIKSQNEINKIKDIIAIASKTFDNLASKISLGMSEREIANIFKKDIIDNGGDHTLYLACTSGNNGYDQIICDPTDKKISNGDVLVIDTGSTKDGYFCDFNRNYGFGEIAAETKDCYSCLWQATESAIAIAKPGVSCSDLNDEMLKVLNKFKNSQNSVGRMGHGLGLQMTEPPSIMKNDKTALEKNMVITLEPSMEYKTGKMIVHEENILITENGCELLSTRTPKSLPIIN